MTARIEIAKLARLLGEDPARFTYLDRVAPADIRAVRERATEVLFGDNRAAYERIAAASRLVPNAITAAVAQRTFGPMMCARVASVLEPDRALDLAGRLDVAFLAGVAEIAQLYPGLLAREGKPPLGAGGLARLAAQDPVGFGVYAAVSGAVKWGKTTGWTRGR